MIWKRIEIISGVLTGPSVRESAGAVSMLFHNMGRRIFLVDAVCDDDCRVTMHDSFSYSEAIVAAEELARAEDIPVRDLVLEGGWE